jgi:hypothetical protein
MIGVEVKRDQEKHTSTLLQTAYIDHIVSKFNLADAKPLSMPLDLGAILSKSQCPLISQEFEEMKGVPY